MLMNVLTHHATKTRSVIICLEIIAVHAMMAIVEMDITVLVRKIISKVVK